MYEIMHQNIIQTGANREILDTGLILSTDLNLVMFNATTVCETVYTSQKSSVINDGFESIEITKSIEMANKPMSFLFTYLNGQLHNRGSG